MYYKHKNTFVLILGRMNEKEKIQEEDDEEEGV